MKINSISISSSSALDLELDIFRPVCLINGRLSDLVLDLIREIIGDPFTKQDPDATDDGRFVIHADIEFPESSYSICYLRNVDFMGDNRIAASFKANSTEFSVEDTEEYLQKRAKTDHDEHNVFDVSLFSDDDSLLSESDRILSSFYKFADQLENTSDSRPIFIYDLLDRIDRSVDTIPLIERIAKTGRQIFISSVCPSSDEQSGKEMIQWVKI